MALPSMFQTAMSMREFLVVLLLALGLLQRFPLVRLVLLIEAGTHLIFDAIIVSNK